MRQPLGGQGAKAAEVRPGGDPPPPPADNVLTGFVCPHCQRREGVIELLAPEAIWFYCTHCEHRWVAEVDST